MRNFRIAYFAHSVRSDWNNGNAHFLRGLLKCMGDLGHEVTIFEAEDDWSIRNLRMEDSGEESLLQFARMYPGLRVVPYKKSARPNRAQWEAALGDTEIVIFHEWNHPALAHRLLDLRRKHHYRMLFHDTHHRASSSPKQIEQLGVDRCDAVITFGEALSRIYRDRFGLARVWTLHEAADTEIFHPLPHAEKTEDLVWIGNWGDGERSDEICRFLLRPAAQFPQRRFTIFGVRYPETGLRALQQARICYGGYLPNLEAPRVYASARLTVHIPREQYANAMNGIPTIRVFEALACSIPLISAPWQDVEQLFRPNDFRMIHSTKGMVAAIRALLDDPKAAEAQAARGRETVLARHTCRHRAEQLTSFCEELFQ